MIIALDSEKNPTLYWELSGRSASALAFAGGQRGVCQDCQIKLLAGGFNWMDPPMDAVHCLTSLGIGLWASDNIN